MKNIMQAYELKGKIDPSGNLLITEPVNLPPQILTNEEELKQAFNNGTTSKRSRKSRNYIRMAAGKFY